MPALSSEVFISITAFFRRLQNRVKAAKHRHRQNNVAIFAAHVEIPQHIVGDAPDKIRYPIKITVAHGCVSSPD
jgi:hypothetical protein